VPIGAGVHTARTWFGAVGQGSHIELTMLGDAVNIAARSRNPTYLRPRGPPCNCQRTRIGCRPYAHVNSTSRTPLSLAIVVQRGQIAIGLRPEPQRPRLMCRKRWR
jgi:hypothetical protein